MNRKGQVSDYVIAFVPRVIFLIVVLGSIYFLVHSFVRTQVDTKDAELNLFVERLLYSRNGLSATDRNTEQAYPGIIDLYSRNLEDRLAKSMQYSDSQHIAARMRITDAGGTELSTVYYNKQWYERWSALTGYSGPGGAKSITRKLYVLLKDQSSINIILREANLKDGMEYLTQSDVDTMRDEIQDIESSANRDQTLVPGYLEVTVVMPND